MSVSGLDWHVSQSAVSDVLGVDLGGPDGLAGAGGVGLRLLSAGLTRQHVEATLIRYLISFLTIALNIVRPAPKRPKTRSIAVSIPNGNT